MGKLVIFSLVAVYLAYTTSGQNDFRNFKPFDNSHLDLKPVKTISKKNINKKVQRDRIAAKLRNVKSTSELLKIFSLDKKYKMVKEETIRGLGIKGPVFRSIDGKAEVKVEALASCIPRLKPVDVSEQLERYNGYVFPKCIMLNQCGGCCFSKELENCVPKSFKKTKKTLFLIDYSSYRSELIEHSFNEHASCGCECKVKATDCRGYQVYKPQACRCVCEKAPMTCPKRKQWSNSACDCECTDQEPRCPSLKQWNKNSCLCECKQKYCPAGNILDSVSCYCLPKNFKSPSLQHHIG